MTRLHPFSLTTLSLLTLTTFFIIIRLTQLTTLPPGFFVDEASIAYNAFSILETGRDEHGRLLPVFFKAFGEYKSPLYIYSQLPAFALLKPSIFTSRLTSALWGLASAFSFSALIYHLTKNRLTTLFGLALILTNSTHLILSRVTFEIATYLALLPLSLFAFLRFTQTHKSNYFHFFTFLTALSFYAYTSAKVFSILTLIIGLALAHRFLSTKSILISAVIFTLTLTPAFIWETYHPGTLTARYHVVSVFSHQSGFSALSTITSNYFSHFTPKFLFLTADGNLRHSLGFHSLFLWICAPLIFLGLKTAFTKHRLFFIFILVLTLAAPIPAAVTIQSPHVLRSIPLLIFGLIFASLGFHHLHTSNRFWSQLTILLFCLESFAIINYLPTYINNSKPWFETNTVTALQKATLLPGPYSLSKDLYPGTPVTWAFLRSYPPGEYQRHGIADTNIIDPPTLRSQLKLGTSILDSTSCRQLDPTINTHSHVCLVTKE